MRKLGLVRDIDLALHLPLRHEDETEVLPIGQVRDGQTAQVEGVVRDCQVELRNRRQLIVRMADDSGVLTLRFLNFYPAHQKTMARGQRLRVRGEVRHGFFGPEMLHPSFKAVQPGDPLPSALTPVLVERTSARRCSTARNAASARCCVGSTVSPYQESLVMLTITSGRRPAVGDISIATNRGMMSS